MLPRSVCLSTRAFLAALHASKQSFDAAFDKALASNNPSDITQAQNLKQTFIEQATQLRETLYPVEAERLFNLEHQYTTQVDLLKRTDLLQTRTETDSSGVKTEILFMTGINGTEYPIPSYETVVSRLAEKKELFRLKADQGFMKLNLVPFGMSLDLMIERLKKFLLAYKAIYEEKHKHDIPPGLLYRGEAPIWIGYQQYNGADKGETLFYNHTSFDQTNHGGKTKTQILTDQQAANDTAPGWRILFSQAGEDGRGICNIPKEGAGKMRGEKIPRRDIEAGQRSKEYLAHQQATSFHPDSPYQGEAGIAPEEWIILFMVHLEETGEPLDNWENDKDSIALLIGAWFPVFNRVPTARRNLFSPGVIFDCCEPGVPDAHYGVRFVVRG